jgi:hypothetical protein
MVYMFATGLTFLWSALSYTGVEISSAIERTNVTLTIYGPSLTLVEEERKVALSKGMNRVVFTWPEGDVEPGTIHIESAKPQDVWSVRRASLRAGNRSVVWEIESAKEWSGPVRVTYYLKGFSWNFRYEAFTDPNEAQMELIGWAGITNNTEEAYRNAKVRLVLGSPRLVPSALREAVFAAPPQKAAPEALYRRREPEEGEFQQEGFSEYSMFTLKEPESLEPSETRQAVAIRSPKVTLKKYYVYDPRTYGERVAMLYEFKNSKENGLGEPLPNGVIRVFRRDEGGTLALLGEATTGLVSSNEDVKLHLGTAVNVLVDRRLVDIQRFNEVIDPEKKRVVRYDQTEQYRISVRNRGQKQAEVRVVEYITPPWTMQESSHKYEKEAADRIRFTVAVAPNAEEVITYKVVRRIVSE